MSRFNKLQLKRNPAQNTGAPSTEPVLTRPTVSRNDPIAAAMEHAATEIPRLLTPKAVSDMLGLTERTLERWRITGEGPRYSKLSRSTVRYLAEDVAAFINDNLKASTAQ